MTHEREQDRGAAMIMVLGMISVMTVVVAAALSYAVNVVPQVRRDESWQAALAAAQAGWTTIWPNSTEPTPMR
ncbi:MAG: hypothetical protein IPN52_03380 [Micrococcales bacterium]|nr:hypothetical protein [Micrococcales bacterium]